MHYQIQQELLLFILERLFSLCIETINNFAYNLHWALNFHANFRDLGQISESEQHEKVQFAQFPVWSSDFVWIIQTFEEVKATTIKISPDVINMWCHFNIDTKLCDEASMWYIDEFIEGVGVRATI